MKMLNSGGIIKRKKMRRMNNYEKDVRQILPNREHGIFAWN